MPGTCVLLRKKNRTFSSFLVLNLTSWSKIVVSTERKVMIEGTRKVGMPAPTALPADASA